jgi:hypothetical protein
MDELLIPVTKPSFNLAFSFARLHLFEQETELLAECVQALPPVAAAVLVPVPREDVVEERVDVEQHCLVVWSCHEEGGGGNCGHVVSGWYSRI